MYKNIALAVAISAAAVNLVGCGGSSSYVADASDEALVTSAGVGSLANFYGEEITPEQEKELLAKRVLHFDFDKYSVDAEGEKVLAAHAKKLLENPDLRLRASGHCDKRGSREYNIGLGERRANAVTRVLALKGVPSDRLIAVSYGKEQPVALGDGESDHAKNRRTEIDYEG